MIAFPPLPRRPEPPQLAPDARQTKTVRIVGNIGGVLAGAGAELATANLTTGFHAAAADLGKLQAALEAGLVRFDMPRVADRWDEVHGWICQVVFAWIQRVKQLKVERREEGVRIELITQDDLGYYEYGFDVFPGRRPG